MSDQQEAYFRALGRFMHEYGVAESSLNSMLLRYAAYRHRYFVHLYQRTPNLQIGEQGESINQFYIDTLEQIISVVRSVMVGQRLSALKDTFRRVLKASGEDGNKIKEELDHLGHIQYLRDRLAHNAARYYGQSEGKVWYSTSRSSIAPGPSIADGRYFYLKMLDDTSYDMTIAVQRINVKVLGHEFDMGHPFAGLTPHDPQEGMYGPYKYKPNELKSKPPFSYHSS